MTPKKIYSSSTLRTSHSRFAVASEKKIEKNTEKIQKFSGKKNMHE
jgi:hypothetical protein